MPFRSYPRIQLCRSVYVRLCSTRHRDLFALALIALACAAIGCGAPRVTQVPLSLLLGPHGTVQRVSCPSFRDGRECFLYLPPMVGGLVVAPKQVVCILDGQSVFGGNGTLMANVVADTLIQRGHTAPFAILAIASGPGNQRVTEYTPWPNNLPADSSGGGGQQFLLGVRDTLLPDIRSRYGLPVGPGATVLIGMSLGGLLAVYAGFSSDSTFCAVGALSPEYSWSGGRVFEHVRSHADAPLSALYQDMGTVDDNSMALLVKMGALVDSIGFVPGCSESTSLAYGGNHTIQSWAKRLPATLEFLLRDRDTTFCDRAKALEPMRGP
jgi:predicted alpha/beta superfamily hydrolase